MKKFIAVPILIISFLVGFYGLNNSNEPDKKEAVKKPKSSLYLERFNEFTNYYSSDITTEGAALNVRLNNSSGVSEPKIAINPNDINNFAAVSNDFTLAGSNNARFFYSLDGGVSWVNSVVPLSGLNGYDDATDPAVAFDADGNIYYAIVQYQIFGYGDGIFVNKSIDKGVTWNSSASKVKANNDPLTFEDRPAITVDISNTANRNFVYVIWTSLGQTSNKILLSKSINGGTTFLPPVEIASGNVHYASVKTDAAGNVFAAYTSDRNSIQVVKSTDAGLTFSAPVTAAAFEHAGILTNKAYLLKKSGNNGIRVSSYPSLAIDDNKLYLVYTAKNGDDLSDIFLVKSEDKGSNWSVPVRVNNDDTKNDQFMPDIVISNSNIYIMWQDSRNDNDNLLTETYLASSADALTFDNQKISSGAFNPHNIMLGNYIGDYNGIAAAGNVIASIWTDGRNNNFDLYAGIIQNNPSSADGTELTLDFSVQQNYPNPFNPSTIISYSIPENGAVEIKLFDILGKEIAVLFEGNLAAGNHSFHFDAGKAGLTSGVYFYSVSFNGRSSINKMILTK
jgi:hypothetical protein